MGHWELLICAGFLAGAMNALAGGGSFVSLPALIASGLPSVLANATSTVALLPGGIVSAFVYRAPLPRIGEEPIRTLGEIGGVPIRWLLAITLVGGFTGALLLLWTPTAAFDLALPWLLLLATLTLAFGRRLGEVMRRSCRLPSAAVLFLQFLLAVYGGYFGGAVGIAMLAVWGLLENVEISKLHAPRTQLVAATNLTAALLFIAGHAVRWPDALETGLGAVLGGLAGAHIGRRLPSRIVRVGTLVLTASITVMFFARYYFYR